MTFRSVSNFASARAAFPLFPSLLTWRKVFPPFFDAMRLPPRGRKDLPLLVVFSRTGIVSSFLPLGRRRIAFLLLLTLFSPPEEKVAPSPPES